MTTDFAIYDMDRTVTRHATYTPFLLHCALRRAPWRLLLLPFVIASMLAYVTKLIDRGRLKEINHRLLLGHKRHPHELKPLVESFAAKTVAHNIRPGARSAIARDHAEGRRVVMATASYRLYADAIGKLLGFDDVIGTGSIIGLDERVHAKIDGENCYGPAKLTAQSKNASTTVRLPSMKASATCWRGARSTSETPARTISAKRR